MKGLYSKLNIGGPGDDGTSPGKNPLKDALAYIEKNWTTSTKPEEAREAINTFIRQQASAEGIPETTVQMLLEMVKTVQFETLEELKTGINGLND
jgi:hypothetical protein